jgi:hypothetical protein
MGLGAQAVDGDRSYPTDADAACSPYLPTWMVLRAAGIVAGHR